MKLFCSAKISTTTKKNKQNFTEDDPAELLSLFAVNKKKHKIQSFHLADFLCTGVKCLYVCSHIEITTYHSNGNLLHFYEHRSHDV